MAMTPIGLIIILRAQISGIFAYCLAEKGGGLRVDGQAVFNSHDWRYLITINNNPLYS
jgi:hypothetical protein